MMTKVFRNWIGGEASKDGSTITFSLSEGGGDDEHRVTLAFELAEALAHNLLELKAQALARQDQGVQRGKETGETMRVAALPLSAFEVGHVPAKNKVLLQLWTMRNAQYIFSLPADAAHALAAQLSRTLPRNNKGGSA